MLYALGQKRQQMPFNKFKNKIKKSNHARFPCHTIHPFLSLLPPPLHALRRLYIPPEVSLFFFSYAPAVGVSSSLGTCLNRQYTAPNPTPLTYSVVYTDSLFLHGMYIPVHN